MEIGNAPSLSTMQHVVALVNTASDDPKTVAPDARKPVIGRKEESAKADNELSKKDISRIDVERLTQRMNQIMRLIDKRLQFEVGDESGLMDIRVKVIDEQTGKVLAIIPPKSLQDLLGNFRDATGMIFDGRA